jgi:hypothetical protein
VTSVLPNQSVTHQIQDTFRSHERALTAVSIFIGELPISVQYSCMTLSSIIRLCSLPPARDRAWRAPLPPEGVVTVVGSIGDISKGNLTKTRRGKADFTTFLCRPSRVDKLLKSKAGECIR